MSGSVLRDKFDLGAGPPKFIDQLLGDGVGTVPVLATMKNEDGVILLLGVSFFTGLSMIVASIVKTRERFMGIGQVITLPLFFASNAIYPIHIMPPWLQVVAKINPLSYMVEGLRSLLVGGVTTGLPADIGILLAATLIISSISAYMYPKVVI